ncbi:hypothetical protein [Bacteroides acidifaciens]|jgi:hypothetical protein|uniref:hypothetical protein n=1 Tax=Bacteroides acidifaciens TaxID=85831 RepID=UPI00138F58DC|nr:hypothetical protein [Bacteroides acidifaciens]MBF0729295.1 hypothetical protein [Bacteroides acidifaciens]MBF0837435.1 hypothetical protein [Bacteroides acidifaciens]
MQLAFYGHNMAVADITYKNVAVRQDIVDFRLTNANWRVCTITLTVWTDLIKTR